MSYQDFFKRLYPYIKPHLTKLVITAIAMILAAAIQIAQPELLGQIIDKIFIDNRSAKVAFFFSMLMLILFILYSLFSFAYMSANAWISNKVIMKIRKEMFFKIHHLPKAFFDKRATGKTLSKLTFDIEQIAGTTSTMWIILIRDSVTVIGLLMYLLYKNWQLSIPILILLPIISYVLKYTAKRIRKSSTNLQKSMGIMTHILNENISGNSLVKIYHAQKQEQNKFNQLINHIRQQNFKIETANAANMLLIYTLIGLGLSIVLYVSSINLNMSSGEFISFFTAMGMLISPAKNLANLNKPLQKAIAASMSVFPFLDTDEEHNSGDIKLKNIKGKIEFHNVNFSYSKNKLILKNINLTINPGETVAFVGATGSGKSTLANMICKFYLPQQGHVSIDDVDINDIETDNLRQQIAIVDQKVVLFNDTVTKNISLGEENSIDITKVKNAAKASCATEFINDLADGFNTEVGEDGVRLSGGQRQRIAIARAIYKNASILIFDEATSALDFKTETKIKKAIDNIKQNRTTIIIAHRLSTIESADKIVVLKDGKIIEQGSHKKLLKLEGEYAKLYETQFS